MASRKNSKKLSELASEPDPSAPLDSARFLVAARLVLKLLEADLLARARESAAVTEALKARHAAEKKAERTAEAFAPWQRQLVEQVAAAWLLSCVFARALEDRGLLERNRIAGPGATDAQKLFFELAPSLTERDYLYAVFRELSHHPAAADLFGPKHNPVWLLAPSAEGAKALLALFRTPSADAPAFRFGVRSTRYLGDLYQDLNENVRERFALLQTPDFVEAFILDRTLDPAIDKFGLDDTDLIDPTCGSGHFLLGAFDRFFDRLQRARPGDEPRLLAKAAMAKVHGADLNPYAVAIAKFRLTLAFLEKAGIDKLRAAPALDLKLAVADSLLYNPQLEQGSLFHQEGADAAKWERRAFSLEDEEAARAVLHREYAAVVGNPPYITVKDKALREQYRKLYPSASGKYSLSVPFCERFFQLAKKGGRVGQITSNSFMKREFGKKLIENYLPSVNLDLIVNTSGAYIPGHGTPTVLLFGTHEPAQGDDVLAVLAKRGEPSTPTDPAKGLVWTSIVMNFETLGFDDDYVSVERVERTWLARHPWVLPGGGGIDLFKRLEAASDRLLGDVADAIGYSTITGEDNVLMGPRSAYLRAGVRVDHVRRNVVGEEVRDWSIGDGDFCVWPNTDLGQRLAEIQIPDVLQFLWAYRTSLKARKAFGTPIEKKGIPWWALREVYHARMRTPLTITFAFVATHNHFVLDHGGKVFKQTAPIIKLPETATEEDHLALLAYLNSSTACFWMKQVLQNRAYGADASNARITSIPWEDFYEFAGTPLKQLPLPPDWRSLAELGRCIVDHVEALTKSMPSVALAEWSGSIDTALSLNPGNTVRDGLQRLVALQEELDWKVYELFGLLDDDARRGQSERVGALFPSRWRELDPKPGSPWPSELPAGHRPFEVRLARSAPTQWFVRNQYVLPEHDHLEALHKRAPSSPRDALDLFRFEQTERSSMLATLEQPEHKRRWTVPDVAADRDRALREWTLATVEAAMHAPEIRSPSVLTVAWFAQDPPRTSVIGSRYLGVPTWNELEASKPTWADIDAAGKSWDALDGTAWFTREIPKEAIPFLAAYRLTEPGLEKRAAWEKTWDLQRREDRGENVGTIPVPPKYDPKDFRDPSFYRLRGKLDVPKERFISYPGCESDEDTEPLYGWAGWTPEQRAKALATLYYHRKTEEGWDKPRLTPLLAGLQELQLWLDLWHADPADDYGGLTPADYYRGFWTSECQTFGLTPEDLKAWRPPEKGKGRGGRKKAGS